MSNAFGLIPLDEHPDRELLARIAASSRFSERWEAARSQRAKNKLLKEQHELGFPCTIAMCLEQAMATLQALDDAPVPAIVTFDDD